MAKLLSASLWIKIFAALLILGLLLLLTFGLKSDEPAVRAMVAMILGLNVLWVGVGGTIMVLRREQIRTWVVSHALGWEVKFLLLAIGLALIEEAIATLMTNLAPLMGIRLGEAYITASANYFDVILFHSVVVLIPMFAAWVILLERWDFSPGAVFLLFGLTGTLSETLAFGGQNLALLPLWTFIYGLMIYLPAYSLPTERSAAKPRLSHYAIALILPFVFAIPVALLVGVIHPIAIHFPPIPANSIPSPIGGI